MGGGHKRDNDISIADAELVQDERIFARGFVVTLEATRFSAMAPAIFTLNISGRWSVLVARSFATHLAGS